MEIRGFPASSAIVVEIYDRGDGLPGLIGALWSGCNRWMDRVSLGLGLRLVLVLIVMIHIQIS